MKAGDDRRRAMRVYGRGDGSIVGGSGRVSERGDVKSKSEKDESEGARRD